MLSWQKSLAKCMRILPSHQIAVSPGSSLGGYLIASENDSREMFLLSGIFFSPGIYFSFFAR